MKTPDYFRLLLSITIALTALLSGCNLSNVKIGEIRVMDGINEDGHISYNYSIFTGFESGSMQADTGQIFSFYYEATVIKGSLIIEWQDPNGGVVWQKNLVESDRGKDEIVIEFPGRYTIVIQGKGASGNFDVSWKLK